jgi:ribosomal protein S7
LDGLIVDQHSTSAQHQTPSIADAFNGPTQYHIFHPPLSGRQLLRGLEQRIRRTSPEKMEQQIAEEVGLIANGHSKKNPSKLRLLQERVNETDRSVARAQRLADEITDALEQKEQPAQCTQTEKENNHVLDVASWANYLSRQ